LILASASPRRRNLVNLLPYKFSFASADCNEEVSDYIDSSDFALQLAERKASVVAKDNPKIPVIGCDTIVVLDDIILGKPTSKLQATQFLNKLSGRQHEVITAFCITVFDEMGKAINTIKHAEKTIVEFGELTLEAIEDYVDSGSPMDKAGAYGIQDDKGALFVKRIIGDYYNVVGLPLYSLNQSLTQWFTLHD
jgi:septum formation protein